MTFREFAKRILEPAAQWAMILGIVFLCQPWIEVLHQYSVTLMLLGIIAFNIAIHVPSPPARKAEGEVDAAAPVGRVVGGETGHG